MIFSNDLLPASLKSNFGFYCCPSSNNSSFLCTLTVHSLALELTLHFLSSFASLLQSFLQKSPRHSAISHSAFSDDWFLYLLPQPLTLSFNLKICLLMSLQPTNSVHQMVNCRRFRLPTAKIGSEFDRNVLPTDYYSISTPKHTSSFLREKAADSHYLSSTHSKVFTCLRPYYNCLTGESCVTVEFGRPSWVSPKLSSFIAFKFRCLLLGLDPFMICFQLNVLLCVVTSTSLQRQQIRYQSYPHSIIFVFCCRFFDHLTSSDLRLAGAFVNLHQGLNIDLRVRWRAV